MTKATDREIITRAVALLAEGLLTSLLPGRLKIEFQLTDRRARELAAKALERRRQ